MNDKDLTAGQAFEPPEGGMDLIAEIVAFLVRCDGDWGESFGSDAKKE